jgi:glyoxylase-like metal-dependent hydrolase (beta-lactamase superfamily II)
LSCKSVCFTLVLCGYSHAAARAEPTLDAQGIVRASLALHGQASERAGTAITYEGQHLDAGHYARPRELRAYPLRTTLRWGADGSVRMHSALGQDAFATGDIELTPHAMYFQELDESQARPDSARERTAQRYRLASYLPSRYLALVLAERPELQRTAARTRDGNAADVVSFVDSAGIARSMVFDAESHRLEQVEQRESDALFGDDRPRVEYVEQRKIDGLLVPTVLRRHRLWFVEDDLKRAAQPDPLPALHKLATSAPEPDPAPKVLPVAAGLFEIRLEGRNNRCWFVERDDHVIAFEAPLSSAVGERLLNAIADATGGKPVRQLFVSHHHPDYVGGIRPFVARGVTLVTTPGNVEYLRQIAAAPRELEPDLQAQLQRPAAIEVVQRSRAFKAGFVAYDIGSFTGHTDEYLVYHFPSQHLLLEGDMVSPRPGPTIFPAGDRGLGLLTAIDKLGLDVQTIYESWPLHDRAPLITIDTLRTMVELRRVRDLMQ